MTLGLIAPRENIRFILEEQCHLRRSFKEKNGSSKKVGSKDKGEKKTHIRMKLRGVRKDWISTLAVVLWLPPLSENSPSFLPHVLLMMGNGYIGRKLSRQVSMLGIK